MTPAPAASAYDVIVMGGGLAGLTLALQLRVRCPGIEVLVLERRRHPVPVAAHKVGESTVEIGAHYFSDVLGLEPHLREAQLRKFGFRFFFSHGRRDIGNVLELGASRPLPTPAWQIDRGLFENFLAEEAVRRGVHFVDGATVRELALARPADAPAGASHRLAWRDADGAERQAEARWLVDACGRAGLLRRRLGLAEESPHRAHAVWFRVAHRLDVDAWCEDPAWRARTTTPTRWLSTNHMVGPGYWVWLIPLASGSHSVGIVADPRWHALESMNTFDKAMEWLKVNQPLVFDKLDGQRHTLQDFAFLRHFSHDCRQVFSAGRWAIAGEAGRFLDPFYSPGSDFIAMGNGFITELVARDRAGKPIAAHAQVFEQTFRSVYDSTMVLYRDQYGIFGSAEVLPAKVLWDYTYYWGVLAPLACNGKLTDLALLSRLREPLARAQALNLGMQELLREWAAAIAPDRDVNPPAMIDQASLPWFVEMNRALSDRPDDALLLDRIRAAVGRLESMAVGLLARADASPGLTSRVPATTLRATLGVAADLQPDPDSNEWVGEALASVTA